MKKTFQINEKKLENFIEEKLNKIGWNSISPNFYRTDNQEVINKKIFFESIKNINNIKNDEIIEKIWAKIENNQNNSLIEQNKIFTEFICEYITIYDEIQKKYINIKLINDEDIESNNFQLIRHLEVSDGSNFKRFDIILYINGLPIIVMELKSEIENETIRDAFNQIEHYKNMIPQLFYFNLFNVITNKWVFKYGSITSKFSHFFKWFDFENKNEQGNLSFINKLEKFFNKKRIINMIFKYSFFDDKNIKYIAAQHQIRATKKTINKIISIENNEEEKNKVGIIWHTQGSGKTITMILICNEIQKKYPNSTIILITDRKQLHIQITNRFQKSRRFLWIDKIENIKTRSELKEKLKNIKNFGIFSSTIHKFWKETGLLSKRDNIFVLVDEAHRTQNIKFDFLVDKEEKKLFEIISYAKCLRIAFPNAKFIGFTGTPLIEELDKDTRKIFGNYIDTYYIHDAIKDGVIVPIEYELRKIDLLLDPKYLKEIDKIQKKYNETLNPNSKISQIKNKKLLDEIKRSLIFEDDDVINVKVKDILNHWDKRKQILNGKSLIVVNSRNVALKYYKKMIELRPELEEKIILIITKSIKDTKEMLEARVKDEDLLKVTNDFQNTQKYKIAIVVNKWLTGFDCQDLDTLYLDKIIQKHNLLQAIARVNRTFEKKEKNEKIMKKENGLVVDYVGIIPLLESAFEKYYSASKNLDEIPFSIKSIEKIKEKLIECLNLINDNYIENLFNIQKLNEKEKYKFAFNSAEKLFVLNNEEKNKFLKLNFYLQQYYKASYTILNNFQKTLAKFVELIKQILNTSFIKRDAFLIFSIEKIKKAVNDAIKVNKSEINIIDTKINFKNIFEISESLINESEKISETNPNIAVSYLISALKIKLNDLANRKPIFAKKASDKLKEIIDSFDEEIRINDFLKKDMKKLFIFSLKELKKEILEKEKEEDVFEDKQLMAFFEIVSEDKYLNKNRPILKKIAKDLLKVTKEYKTSQFENNERVQSKLSYKLRKLLKDKYNYPPKNLNGVTGLIVDRIKKEIKINRNNFD